MSVGYLVLGLVSGLTVAAIALVVVETTALATLLLFLFCSNLGTVAAAAWHGCTAGARRFGER
jgi:hypothetical protein